MTKKGYQKRLPTVLAPVVPAPRLSSEAIETESPAGTPAPQPAAPPQPPQLRSPEGLIGRAVGLLLLVVLGVAGLAVFLVANEPDGLVTERGRGSAASDAAPRMLAHNESYVDTRVLANGDVVVRQWIRADAPIDRLRLALPRVPGVVDLSATGVEVRAAGAVVAGPATMTGVGSVATYRFEETADVQLSYVLTGAVERSDSAVGRALALATTLDVRYSPQTERETRIVHAPEVLSLACSGSPEASTVPCGAAIDVDLWRVELTGPSVGDRIVAQITLR